MSDTHKKEPINQKKQDVEYKISGEARKYIQRKEIDKSRRNFNQKWREELDNDD